MTKPAYTPLSQEDAHVPERDYVTDFYHPLRNKTHRGVQTTFLEPGIFTVTLLMSMLFVVVKGNEALYQRMAFVYLSVFLFVLKQITTLMTHYQVLGPNGVVKKAAKDSEEPMGHFIKIVSFLVTIRYALSVVLVLVFGLQLLGYHAESHPGGWMDLFWALGVALHVIITYEDIPTDDEPPKEETGTQQSGAPPRKRSKRKPAGTSHKP
jgi:hypothetical protein